MAGLARRREHRRNVIRIRRCLILRLMAAVAVGGSARVLSTNVATRARYVHVRACQREARVVVIKSRRLPGRRAVTDRAVEGEPGSLVVRNGRTVICSKVTSRASRTQVVVSVYMASRTRNPDMRTGQREASFTVIEGCTRPRGCRVAYRTVCWEARGHVVRIGSLVEIR